MGPSHHHPMDASDNAPLDFHHPYTPYDVQIEFMRAVYGVLEKGGGQVGILESPTGTVCGWPWIPSCLTLCSTWTSRRPHLTLMTTGKISVAHLLGTHLAAES